MEVEKKTETINLNREKKEQNTKLEKMSTPHTSLSLDMHVFAEDSSLLSTKRIQHSKEIRITHKYVVIKTIFVRISLLFKQTFYCAGCWQEAQ